jgi:hypothetical protein|tara:strand:+ start:337 stop:537 length:201 start_codon:yes stop_codon:yes gene_type:complete
MEQFEVGDLIKLKRSHGPGQWPRGDELAIVLNVPLSALFSRMKIQYIDKQQPYMTDPLLWKIVSRG